MWPWDIKEGALSKIGSRKKVGVYTQLCKKKLCLFFDLFLRFLRPVEPCLFSQYAPPKGQVGVKILLLLAWRKSLVGLREFQQIVESFGMAFRMSC